MRKTKNQLSYWIDNIDDVYDEFWNRFNIDEDTKMDNLPEAEILNISWRFYQEISIDELSKDQLIQEINRKEQIILDMQEKEQATELKKTYDRSPQQPESRTDWFKNSDLSPTA